MRGLHVKTINPMAAKEGQIVEAWSVFKKVPFFVGRIMYLIEPDDQPDPVRLAGLFAAALERRVKFPNLTPLKIPRDKSKYRRVILVGGKARVAAVTLGKDHALVLLKDLS